MKEPKIKLVFNGIGGLFCNADDGMSEQLVLIAGEGKVLKASETHKYKSALKMHIDSGVVTATSEKDEATELPEQTVTEQLLTAQEKVNKTSEPKVKSEEKKIVKNKKAK